MLTLNLLPAFHIVSQPREWCYPQWNSPPILVKLIKIIPTGTPRGPSSRWLLSWQLRLTITYGHDGVPRLLLKYYFGCVYEGVWKSLTFESADKVSRLFSLVWVASYNLLKAWTEQKGLRKGDCLLPDSVQGRTLDFPCMQTWTTAWALSFKQEPHHRPTWSSSLLATGLGARSTQQSHEHSFLHMAMW